MSTWGISSPRIGSDADLEAAHLPNLVAGQRWKEALQKAAKRCEVVLALVSADWLASGWCKSEIAAARLMDKKIVFALILR